jgi:D-sedoheptulose 7-phosphate isomerase
LAERVTLPDNHWMNEERVRAIAAESAALQRSFIEASAGLLCDVSQRLSDALHAGGKLLVCGNGGSAADAQHLAAELVGRYEHDRAGLAAIALTTDPSVVTSVGNDFGFDDVFRRQVEALGRPGDVVLGISTSGNSRNVVAALSYARDKGLYSVGLTGRGGGIMADVVDDLIDVAGESTARIQEVHGLVVHILCEFVEQRLIQPTEKT